MSSNVKSFEHPDHAFSETGEKTFKQISQHAYNIFGSIVIVDFIAGLFIVGDGYAVPGMGIPASTLSLALISFVGFFRAPKRHLGPYFFALLVVAVSVLWTTQISFLMDAPAGEIVRRAVRMGLVLLCCLFLVEGRIDLKSLIKGFVFGLAINMVLFYSGLAPDTYGGYLTGYLGDKNKAGLYYLVGGMLAIAITKNKLYAAVLFSATAATVWLTGSRTTLAALLVAFIWAQVITNLPKLARYLSIFGILYLLSYLEDKYAHIGVFSERVGSDLLRGRIDKASWNKLLETPFQGLGFGEARVLIEGRTWYFHNSYWTLFVEGGWVHLILVLSITLILGLGIFRRVPYTPELRRAEGALAGLLVAASRLGEVFLTNAWMLTMALLMIAAINAYRMGVNKEISEESQCRAVS
ncbi:O-antigen ligase family protein [Dermabacteraceae bacterium P7006]